MKRLQPESLATNWQVSRDEILNELKNLVGEDRLRELFHPKSSKQAVQNKSVRKKFNRAIDQLHNLSFIKKISAEEVLLLPGVMRFSEPVRTASANVNIERLKHLIANQEVPLEQSVSQNIATSH